MVTIMENIMVMAIEKDMAASITESMAIIIIVVMAHTVITMMKKILFLEVTEKFQKKNSEPKSKVFQIKFM